MKGIKISWNQALKIWTSMYAHILQNYHSEGKWLFLHYNQVISKEGLDRLEDFTGAIVDRSFPDPSLRRSVSNTPVPKNTRKIYQTLCKLANYHE